PAQLLQFSQKCGNLDARLQIPFSNLNEHTDAPYPVVQLRPRYERPCRRRAAEQRDELAPVAVGTPIAGGPPRRSVRAAFPHTAPTSGVRRQIACRARDEGCAVLEASRQSAASSVPS